MDTISTRCRAYGLRIICLMAGALLALAAMSGSASAQNVGIGGVVGISGGPNQFYIGANYTTPTIARDVQFRPNAEIGVGNDQTLLAVNFDFIHSTPIKNHPASIYFGAGPSFNTSFATSTDTTGGGFDVLIGATGGRFFGELKLGVGNSPTVKFGVGYNFGQP